MIDEKEETGKASSSSGPSRYQRIYSVVRRIPRGKVASYGQVAELAGFSGQARQVGYALNRLQDDDKVPWHRVVNAQGRISRRSNPDFENLQRLLLEAEGVIFDEHNSISFRRFAWRP